VDTETEKVPAMRPHQFLLVRRTLWHDHTPALDGTGRAARCGRTSCRTTHCHMASMRPPSTLQAVMRRIKKFSSVIRNSIVSIRRAPSLRINKNRTPLFTLYFRRPKSLTPEPLEGPPYPRSGASRMLRGLLLRMVKILWARDADVW